MGQLSEIIFFAILASYFLFRLWSVLGQETEEDQERRSAKANPPIDGEAREMEVVSPDMRLSYGVQEGIRSLQEVIPSFDVDTFLEGAQSAYEMITTALCEGDRAQLREMLTPEMFTQVTEELNAREAKKQRLLIEIAFWNRTELDSLTVYEQKAVAVVRYRSRQIRTISVDDVIIENPACIATSVTDIWTFEKGLTDEGPEWFLSHKESDIYA